MATYRADLGKIVSEIKNITVNLIDSNKEAYAENKGTATDVDLVLNIPKPKSAYDIAVDNGFKGTEAEWLESLKSSGSSVAKNIIEFTAGSFSYKEDFTAERSDFNGTMPFGYDFGNGLFCETANNKNVTLGRGTTYSAVDNETGETVWFQGFLSNGNSGDLLRLKISKKATVTIKCTAQKSAVVLAVRDDMSNDFLLSTTIQPDGKLYTYSVTDVHDGEHDLIISVSGGQGLRVTELTWESTVATNYNIYTSQFVDGAENILRPVDLSTSDYPALVEAANNQARHFKLDLRKSNLGLWGCGVNTNDGITDASLKTCTTLDSIIMPNGLEIYSLNN